MFIKDKTKVECRMSGIEWRVVYFRKLLFDTNNEKFRLRKVKSSLRRFASVHFECFVMDDTEWGVACWRSDMQCHSDLAFCMSAYSRRRCTSPTPVSARGPLRSSAPLRGRAVSRRVQEDESDDRRTLLHLIRCFNTCPSPLAWSVGLRSDQTVPDIVRTPPNIHIAKL